MSLVFGQGFHLWNQTWYHCYTTLLGTCCHLWSQRWYHCDITVTSCDITINSWLYECVKEKWSRMRTHQWYHNDITCVPRAMLSFVKSHVISLWHHIDVCVSALWNHKRYHFKYRLAAFVEEQCSQMWEHKQYHSEITCYEEKGFTCKIRSDITVISRLTHVCINVWKWYRMQTHQWYHRDITFVCRTMLSFVN